MAAWARNSPLLPPQAAANGAAEPKPLAEGEDAAAALRVVRDGPDAPA